MSQGVDFDVRPRPLLPGTILEPIAMLCGDMYTCRRDEIHAHIPLRSSPENFIARRTPRVDAASTDTQGHARMSHTIPPQVRHGR